MLVNASCGRKGAACINAGNLSTNAGHGGSGSRHSCQREACQSIATRFPVAVVAAWRYSRGASTSEYLDAAVACRLSRHDVHTPHRGCPFTRAAKLGSHDTLADIADVNSGGTADSTSALVMVRNGL